MKRVVHIIDIDTTIANNDHRAALLRENCIVCGSVKGADSCWCVTCDTETTGKLTQESWDNFLDPELMSFDTPVVAAQRAIAHMRLHDMELHFITGRNEGLREVTEQWLHEHFGYDSSREALKMRPIVDAEVPPSVYKETALQQLIAERNLQDASFFFYEDDPWVFRMYSKYGLVLRCPEAWESFCPSGMQGNGNLRRR